MYKMFMHLLINVRYQTHVGTYTSRRNRFIWNLKDFVKRKCECSCLPIVLSSFHIGLYVLYFQLPIYLLTSTKTVQGGVVRGKRTLSSKLSAWVATSQN